MLNSMLERRFVTVLALLPCLLLSLGLERAEAQQAGGAQGGAQQGATGGQTEGEGDNIDDVDYEEVK